MIKRRPVKKAPNPEKRRGLELPFLLHAPKEGPHYTVTFNPTEKEIKEHHDATRGFTGVSPSAKGKGKKLEEIKGGIGGQRAYVDRRTQKKQGH